MNGVISLSIASIFLFMSGCAKKADSIKPAYVPTVEYSHKSCNQLRDDLIELNREIRVMAGQQDDVATKDQVAMGVGLVLFWPSLFFLATGDDNERKIAELRGEYEAIKIVSKRKNCEFAKELK